VKTILAVLKLFPLVLEAVKAVEQAFPLPGQGRKKLELVLDIVKTAYETGTELAHEFAWEKLVGLLAPMIAKIVGAHNALGLFQTTTAEPSK
jgi:hypothetical protein